MLDASVPAHRADARRVKAFIRSFGILGKTDAIDARALARYGEERYGQPARWQAPNLARGQLQALVLARRDFVEQRTAGANRIAAPGADAAQPYLQCLLDGLAPHPNQSGASNAYRQTKDGRPEVKRVLFMAALSASQYNPSLDSFHQRPVARGKNLSSPSLPSCADSSSSATQSSDPPPMHSELMTADDLIQTDPLLVAGIPCVAFY